MSKFAARSLHCYRYSLILFIYIFCISAKAQDVSKFTTHYRTSVIRSIYNAQNMLKCRNIFIEQKSQEEHPIQFNALYSLREMIYKIENASHIEVSGKDYHDAVDSLRDLENEVVSSSGDHLVFGFQLRGVEFEKFTLDLDELQSKYDSEFHHLAQDQVNTRNIILKKFAISFGFYMLYAVNYISEHPILKYIHSAVTNFIYFYTLSEWSIFTKDKNPRFNFYHHEYFNHQNEQEDVIFDYDNINYDMDPKYRFSYFSFGYELPVEFSQSLKSEDHNPQQLLDTENFLSLKSTFQKTRWRQRQANKQNLKIGDYLIKEKLDEKDGAWKYIHIDTFSFLDEVSHEPVLVYYVRLYRNIPETPKKPKTKKEGQKLKSFRPGFLPAW